MPTSLVLIAGIHGNAWALDAVLADIDRRGVRQIINLGDCAYGSLDPAGTLARLMERAIPTVSGNQDRIVHAPPPEVIDIADQDFITARLGPAQVAWLRDLPQTLVVGDLFCCHGTPASDTTCLLEDVTPHRVRLRADADLAALLAGVNSGSVGVPAYTDDQPHPHAMEAGSPHVRYAILREVGGGWAVELVTVPYDWHRAAAEARRNGRPDRAAWIATGRAG